MSDELIGLRMQLAYLKAQRTYAVRPFDGAVTIFRARKASTQFLAAGPLLGWDRYLTGTVKVVDVDGDHFSLMSNPAVGQIGAVLNRKLLGIP